MRGSYFVTQTRAFYSLIMLLLIFCKCLNGNLQNNYMSRLCLFARINLMFTLYALHSFISFKSMNYHYNLLLRVV